MRKKLKNIINLLSTLLFLISVLGYSQKPEFQDYDQEITGSNLKIGMVAIPEGEFKMGSPNTEKFRFSDEGPVLSVKIDAFWMSEYEITWELYYEYLNSRRDSNSVSKDGGGHPNVDAVAGATIPYVDMSLGMGTGEGMPVGNITRKAASDFCKWLSAKTGIFYRLPTEAEWEYAARAGTETAYYFGENTQDLSEHAWYSENSNDSYHKVGQKKPNPWGLYDMYGNVAEWTLDEYSPDIYQKRKDGIRNPYNIPANTDVYVVRGGSYKHELENLRSATRMRSSSNWKMRDPQFPKSLWWNTDSPFVGFRIVRPKNPPGENKF